MIIGVPKEIKLQEHRIGLTPESVKILTEKKHEVLVESNGGYEAGLSLKATGDCLIVAPPFVCEKKHIDEIIEKLRTGISNYMHDR